MSNNTIANYTLAVSIDPVADLFLGQQASSGTYKSYNRNVLLGLSSQPLGLTDVQSPTNKTFNNTNTVTLKDTLFTLQDDGDTTKQARFQLSGITTGNTRTYTLPDVTDTLMTLTATQTATNKTLTSPTINGGTISNSSIAVDTITGFTTSNSGTIYGIGVTSGVISSASTVNGSALVNSTVTPSKLNIAPATNFTNTSVATTTSTTYTTTLSSGTAPTVTITVGANGIVLLGMSMGAFNSGSNSNLASYSASGSNTIAVADANGTMQVTGTNQLEFSYMKLLTGLTPGSTTFTMNFKVSGGTGSFFRTAITAVPL